MKIVFISMISFLVYYNALSQCEIEITNVSMDTLSIPSKTHTLNNICIKYKTKGRNKLEIYANKELGETQEIINVSKSDNYTELEVINRYGVVITYRFYKDLIKVETFILSNKTYIIEKGSGLSYKISKKLKPNKLSVEKTINM